MNFIKAVLLAALAVTTTGTFAPRSEAAPLPTDVAAMKIALDAPVVQVRYGRWHGGWGYRGGAGYRGWGHRGWGYRGWGLGGVAAGAVVGGAIARSAYYGGACPYYDGGFVAAMLMTIALPTATGAIILATARGIIITVGNLGTDP